MAAIDKQTRFFGELLHYLEFAKASSNPYELIGRIEETISKHYVMQIVFNHGVNLQTSTIPAMEGWVYQFSRRHNLLSTAYNSQGSADRLEALEIGIKFMLTHK